MAFTRKLSNLQVVQLVGDVSNGMTKKAAAEKYEVSLRTVARIFNDEDRNEPKKRRLHPCGSIGAYRRHLRKKEPPCTKCNAANAKYEKGRTA